MLNLALDRNGCWNRRDIIVRRDITVVEGNEIDDVLDSVDRARTPLTTPISVLIRIILNEFRIDVDNLPDGMAHTSFGCGVMLCACLIRPPNIRAIVREYHEQFGDEWNF